MVGAPINGVMQIGPQRPIPVVLLEPREPVVVAGVRIDGGEVQAPALDGHTGDVGDLLPQARAEFRHLAPEALRELGRLVRPRVERARGLDVPVGQVQGGARVLLEEVVQQAGGEVLDPAREGRPLRPRGDAQRVHPATVAVAAVGRRRWGG
eukprot:CAMPEP_0179273534 /NCGR_PEP_ID=MMETSP0797-20121207/33061_1 /TAXON_ID=47934 /ORGANISM="Dinophysis acuminata, Strain DAEP01" /LENGTH=151 /DNA_ID=CAMNT_0020981961 /DNA_START=99 /DNA_END=550 /DNA_ORIENTATION=+